MAIDASKIAAELNAILKQYANGVGEEIEESAKKISRKGVRKLKVRRDGQFNDRTGDYRKGWRAKKVNGIWTVYNRTDYQLTHLLEKGTTVRGRPHSKAYPHIEPVEQEMIEEYLKSVEEAVRGD